ncbi:adhesion G-protein coupled receptor G4 [Esox lucius]|uniref:adhesion G-protein coupled receptor G4 n=1 Tax=Esox lucius TaxID=8010 RepID=UPI0010BD1BE9|nr:adhesion G-protein coupled receptor G4 [Esox lucius]
MGTNFYSVNMTLNMNVTGSDPGTTIQKWVQRMLKKEKMSAFNFRLLNSIFKDITGTVELEKTVKVRNENKFRCTFHVEDLETRNVTEAQRLIADQLSGNHVDDNILVQHEDIHVLHIDPGNCPEETHNSFWGRYIWPITEAQNIQKMDCEKNRGEKACRKCMLDQLTGKATWAKANLQSCKPVITISDLDHVTVTENNSADVLDIIEVLVRDKGVLSDSQLASVIQKLDEVLQVCVVTPQLGRDIVNIIGDILRSDTDLSEVTNNILDITDRVGDQMKFQEESLNVTVPSLSLSMVNVDKDNFQGFTFGVSSFSTDLVPEIFVNQTFVSQPPENTVVSISLPSALQNFFPPGHKKNRIQFHFYGTQDLFEDPETNWILNSYVVSASVSNSNISLLLSPVVVTLRHLKPKERSVKEKCVYWDFQKNSGRGGWNSSGCETLPGISAYQTICHCFHLTHFGVLLDVTRTPISEADQEILTVISYLGCGVSSIFLGISLLTYLAFNYVLCIATAATLHYFLLASFTWMALEAIHMYFALVRVFNIYIPSYIFKFCLLGWGVPLGIVSLILAIQKDAYGSAEPADSDEALQASEPFCWIQIDVFFYVGVVAFVLLVLVFNSVVFIVVLVQIRNMQTNKLAVTGGQRGVTHDLRAVASLTFLLGLTWPITFFTWGPARVPLLYLFTILNSLQGFFIFVFHCLMKENVRKQWKIHLCCGRFRLSDYSDWSRSVMVGSQTKKKHLVQRSVSVKSVSTSSRKVSDDSITASCSSGIPLHQGN